MNLKLKPIPPLRQVPNRESLLRMAAADARVCNSVDKKSPRTKVRHRHSAPKATFVNPARNVVQVPASLPSHFDLACDLFSDDWRQGNHPRVEEYLSWVDECDHPQLLIRLLQIEMEVLRQRGARTVLLNDYLERFPQFGPAVLKAWRLSLRQVAKAEHWTTSEPVKQPVERPESQRVVSIHVVVMSGSTAGQSFVVAAGTSVQIGRSSRSQLCFAADHKLSRIHAQLEVTADGVRLQDLESRNGTRVNGHPLYTSTAIQHDDIIRAGRTKLLIRIERS